MADKYRKLDLDLKAAEVDYSLPVMKGFGCMRKEVDPQPEPKPRKKKKLLLGTPPLPKEVRPESRAWQHFSFQGLATF